jgi:hypothetical protein
MVRFHTAFHTISLLFLWCVILLPTNTSALVVQSTPTPSTPTKLLILGLGRVGLECAKLAVPHLDQVVGTVRRLPVPSSNDNDDDGIERIPFELSSIRPHLAEASHVLMSIPLPKQRDETLERVLQELQEHSSSRNSPTAVLQWVGIVSTTGVYGNHDGAWVTEDSELLCPPESNAHLYRGLEEDQQNDVAGDGSSSSCAVSVFRCSGIYDATRSALHTVYKRKQKGLPQEAIRASDASTTTTTASTSITNRVHSQDIARAIVSCMTRNKNDADNDDNPSPLGRGRIYNLADDLPAPREEVMRHAADLLEAVGVSLVPPPEAAAAAIPQATSSSSSSITTVRERRRQTDRKLVSNQRMKDELLPDHSLLYPTYRQGLQAILMEPNTPWYDEMMMEQRNSE